MPGRIIRGTSSHRWQSSHFSIATSADLRIYGLIGIVVSTFAERKRYLYVRASKTVSRHTDLSRTVARRVERNVIIHNAIHQTNNRTNMVLSMAKGPNLKTRILRDKKKRSARKRVCHVQSKYRTAREATRHKGNPHLYAWQVHLNLLILCH